MSIRTQVKKLLVDGLTKDEVFNELNSQIDEEKLRKSLASLPTLHQRIRNRVLHSLLVFLLSLNVLFNLVEQLGNNFTTLYDLIINLFILIAVIQYRSWIFLGGAIWFLSMFGLTSYQFNDVLSGGLTQLELITFLTLGTTILLIFILMLTIKYRVFPYTTFILYKRNELDKVIYQKNT
ncbi:hypothetical protein [Reichenbachiella sp.]|uniref:hypothetical protein n=1 Tax=Reichenbachiella sp. TaxID=2184521 RepID=UPI003B5A2DF3